MVISENATKLINLLSENHVPFDIDIYRFCDDTLQLQILCPDAQNPLIDAIIVNNDLLEILVRTTDEIYDGMNGVGAFYKFWDCWDRHKNHLA